jgi:hypothetical protein
MATTASIDDYNTIADRIYIEGWGLAFTFGAVDQALVGSWSSATACAALSAFCQFVVIQWSAWVRRHPQNQLLRSLNMLATDARWWVATCMVVLLTITLSPLVQQGRWPAIPFLSQWLPTAEFGSLARDTPALGRAINDIQKGGTIYQAWSEHAVVVSLGLPASLVCAIPFGNSDHAAFCESNIYWTNDPRFYPWDHENDDAYLRSLFPNTPKGKFPPAGAAATLWLQNPSKWSWIGAVEQDCEGEGPFYIQSFEHGLIVGPFAYAPGSKYGQFVAIVANGTATAEGANLQAQKCRTLRTGQ